MLRMTFLFVILNRSPEQREGEAKNLGVLVTRGASLPLSRTLYPVILSEAKNLRCFATAQHDNCGEMLR